MRDACVKLGGDPAKINPQVPCDLVIDHSVIADRFGCATALKENARLEFERNRERYSFLKWAQNSFENVRIVPPGQGICHQLNIENFASVVMTGGDGDSEAPMAYFDTLVGTDSHTPTANGIGVLGWGVGGIEAEAAALGQPITTLVPRVVGVVGMLVAPWLYRKLVEKRKAEKAEKYLLKRDDLRQMDIQLFLLESGSTETQQKELKDGGLIQTTSTADGKDAKVTYVTAPLNQSETQALIDYMYAQMLEIAGVPGRESSSGGNTGAAILLSNGWQLAETMAKTAEPLFHDAEMELLDVIIAILRNTPGVSEDLRGLKKSDVLPKSSRNKTYDLVSRTAALTNLIKLGVDPHHAFPVVDIFDDNQQVVVDSMPRIDKILFEVFDKVTTNDKPDTGDGITVNGVKGANDYNAEQNRENESAK